MIRHLVVAIVVLTGLQGSAYAGVDASQQNAALNALGKRKGAIVMIEIRTGKIVAKAGNEAERPYPTGSIAKLVSAYAGLNSGQITSTTRQECRNTYTINGIRYNCSLPGGHGVLDTKAAIAESCNVWFYKSANKMGAENIRNAWQKLAGVNYPQNKATVQRMAATAEGLQVTPVTMARLSSSISKQDDAPKRVVAAAMRQAALTGTAKELKHSALKPAVKTGSAQHINNPKLRHGWLVGFFPYDKPRYAFAVFCFEGNSFESAVPVAKDFLKRIENAK